MSAAYLKVRLKRFLAGKTLSRDVFLEMPRNGKVLRLAGEGDELRDELLLRLASRGVEFLLVPERTPGETGDSCELYPLLADPGVPEAFETSKVEAQPAFSAPAAPAAHPEARNSQLAPELALVPSSGLEPEPERSFSPEISQAEVVKPFGAGRLLEPEQRVAAGQSEDESVSRVRSWADPQEKATLISSLEENFEDISRLAAEESDRIGGDAVAALRAGLEEGLTVFRSNAHQAPAEAIVAAGAALDACVDTFVNSATTEQETALASEMRTAIEAARQRFVEAAARLADEESFTGRSDAVFEKRFSAEKIVDDVTEMHRTGNDLGSTTLPELHRAKAELQATRAPEIYREKAEELTPDIPESFPNQPGAEAESAAAVSFSSDEAQKAATYSTNARAAVFKELPATAARLAALLAHSIGYANSRYLSDLSLAVIVYFSRKDGALVSEGALPMLARFILEHPPAPEDPAVEDSLEIVRLLEAYFENPECDRSLRDFSRRVFRDTLLELKGRPKGVSPWNEARWIQAVDRGYSIEAQSLCGKATAAAMKTSKELHA